MACNYKITIKRVAKLQLCMPTALYSCTNCMGRQCAVHNIEHVQLLLLRRRRLALVELLLLSVKGWQGGMRPEAEAEAKALRQLLRRQRQRR